MGIDELKKICTQLPGVSESLKWQNDLWACVADKMFFVMNMASHPISASFKIDPDSFINYLDCNGFKPAPYLARYHWILGYLE